MGGYPKTKQHGYPKQWREYVRDYHKPVSEPMRFDLRMVREADILLVNLKGLRNSLETSDEILYGFIKGKPIVGFLEDEKTVKNIHPWKLEQLDRIETGKDAIKNALEYIYSYYVDR